MTILLTFSACTTHSPVPESKKENGNDKRVLNAINVLEKHWEKEYERRDIEDKYLEIINTRIINIKGKINPEEIYGKGDLFEGIDYIVEFDLMSNYTDTTPYYFNVCTDNWVVVHKDGTKEVSKNLLNMYRATTYSSDFTPIIESIEELRGEYDQILEME